MSRVLSIRDFIDLGIRSVVTNEDGDWEIAIDGNARLTADGVARWSANGVLDKEIVVDGNRAVVTGIDTPALGKAVSSLFNTLAGQVNEDTFSKYVKVRKKPADGGQVASRNAGDLHRNLNGGKAMGKIDRGEIGKYIVALENLINDEEDNGVEVAVDDNVNVMDLLMKALADEWLASYQYWVCKNLARGEGRHDSIEEFDQHEKEEKDHADKLMLRIKELGGKPIFNPADWQSIGNPWTVVDTESVCEELDITMKAEQDAIEFYTGAIEACKGVDEVTMRLFRSILSDECEHLYDLQMLKEEHCG